MDDYTIEKAYQDLDVYIEMYEKALYSDNDVSILEMNLIMQSIAFTAIHYVKLSRMLNINREARMIEERYK